MADLSSLPIGLFDSGMGGLTVLKALKKVLPAEDFVFLADTARLPYGTKNIETVERYALKSIQKLIHSHSVKMLIACNSSSSAVLLSHHPSFEGIPIEGIIQPGVNAALESTKNGHILILSNESTVLGDIFKREIHHRMPEAKIDQRACAFFVALAEEGWTKGEVAEASAHKYIDEFFSGTDVPDTVLLACAHFPLLYETISKVVGQSTRLVDPSEATAEAVRNTLARTSLLKKEETQGSVHFMVTDNTARFARIGGRFLGRELQASDIELIDL